MNRFELDLIEQDARRRRLRELGSVVRHLLRSLGQLLMHAPAAPRRALDPRSDVSPAERFVGLANFQDRLKNSRPPRIAVIRSISRSKCSGTSTKFRRSLFTISSGLSE
jgi:hypothetical protein